MGKHGEKLWGYSVHSVFFQEHQRAASAGLGWRCWSTLGPYVHRHPRDGRNMEQLSV